MNIVEQIVSVLPMSSAGLLGRLLMKDSNASYETESNKVHWNELQNWVTQMTSTTAHNAKSSGWETLAFPCQERQS